jgi:hypothetical protein
MNLTLGTRYLLHLNGGIALVEIISRGLKVPDGRILPDAITVRVLEIQREFFDSALLVGNWIDVYVPNEQVSYRLEPVAIRPKEQLGLAFNSGRLSK